MTRGYKKQLKNAIRKKKKSYKENILNQLSCSNKNSKQFWKILDKLNPLHNDNIFKSGISGQRWLDHFKSIFVTDTIKSFPINPVEKGQLDYPITENELENASYILKPGKACGIDGLSNEMILCLLGSNPNILLKLFNACILVPDSIRCWDTSAINPIHKKGSKLDPENYRGISLLSCLGKFFSAILNQRLSKFTIENGILSQEQLGFIPGNRTSDALLILHNLINDYCVNRKKYIYACFVDFKRAFDSIPRHKIFEKLIKNNITGKCYECVKNMYSHDQACIKIGNKMTDTFQTNQGVKQGCILSPTLFNIFLADLPKTLQENEYNSLHLDDKKPISSIIWADDLLILSESESGLNNMLKNLCGYCNENSVRLNLDKTKCMVFNKTGKLIGKVFWFGKEKLETIREYKYLGFLITPSLNLSTSLADLKDRAMRAFYMLKSKMGPLFKKHVDVSLHLFDTLIKPILLYGSDFWGCLKLPKNNPIENLHMTFCKELLGVQKQTPNLGVLLELGRIPLSIFARKNCVKNWERIAVRKNTNLITKTSYEWALQNNSGWSKTVKDYLSQIGLMNVFLNKGNRKVANVDAFNREKGIFYQTSFFEIQNNSSKLKTYSKLKTNIGMEYYLNNIQNITDRISMTKLRLSNHNLMIEKGRHNNIESSNRFCPFCPTCIEDEFHFIIKCPKYAPIRLNLIANINIENQHLSNESLFTFLMENKEIVHHTANFITRANNIREFLLEKHRNSC